MAKQRKKPKKRQSKRLKAKSNATKVQKHPVRTKLPIRKSSRLIQSHHDQIVISTKIPTTSTCIERSIHPDTERPRRWSQIYNLPTKMCCADISREALVRVGLNSCYRCDNFRSDRPFMAPGTKQENTCRQRYDCRRTKKISVSIKFSHRCPTMLAKEDIMYVASPSRDDETNPSSMKRKAA